MGFPFGVTSEKKMMVAQYYACAKCQGTVCFTKAQFTWISLIKKQRSMCCYTQRLLHTTWGSLWWDIHMGYWDFSFFRLGGSRGAPISLLSTSLLLSILKIASGFCLILLTSIWLPTKPWGSTSMWKGGGCLSQRGFCIWKLGAMSVFVCPGQSGHYNHPPRGVPSGVAPREASISSYLQNFSTSKSEQFHSSPHWVGDPSTTPAPAASS